MHTISLLLACLAAVTLCTRWVWARRPAQRTESVAGKIPQTEPSSIDVSGIKPLKPDFDWRHQEPTPWRPWNNGPYHITMGLKPANVENWIEIDNTYLDKYNLKRKLFHQHRSEVLQVLPGCDDGLFEALDLLKETLIRRYPTMFTLANKHTITNLVTGDIWDLSRGAETWKTHHPLEVMSLLRTEDFFLLYSDPETGTTTLKAAGVCFPAGWKIEERIGKTLWGIHAGRVPQYETKLAKSMDRFFMRLKVGGSISRFNYAIDISDTLFHRHSHHNVTELASPLELKDLHIRVERQVLQRLPKSRALLFTIRTYVTPITEVTKDFEIARALKTSTGSYADDVARYKNKHLWDGLLQGHLKEVLGE
ncbi:hypothetical protein BJY04DRAFT_220177 [Aspergillus karnatakaensis]|uniref:heme-dependent oxidative N-demethylase family protein n=1 Tax=Aspergillus karnatakaensis TaxID=1810916 RepID=UPI003CCD4714